ncbi:MAG: carbamoyltransferase HypF [Candidatus Woesearchaeota archaeon]
MQFYKYFVKGIVQGVGFRPYIYKKAKQFNLKGYVKNIGSGVEILVNDKNFIKKLNDLPPLAKIINYDFKEIDFEESEKLKEIYKEFLIKESSFSEGETILPSDVSICEDCLNELRNPTNKRHNYYFITCTNCGPRFTIIEDYPYDRPLTSMNSFKMCEDCKKEYTNALDRRYHAQTIACKNCGPKLFLKKYENNKFNVIADDLEAIKKTAELLKKGDIVSIKGIGGIHLCSTINNVNKIRKMLFRENKPFAIMVKNLNEVEKICFVNEYEKKLLECKEKPIVVLRKKNKNDFLEVSELDSLGVMLPYTGLHYLLFDYIDEPLVMTSFNMPGEPMFLELNDETIKNNELLVYYLEHERTIINRCDDSVVKVISFFNNKKNHDEKKIKKNIDFKKIFLRRSRGYNTEPIELKFELPFFKDILALGAELNNSVCCVKGNKAFLSQYVGQTQKEKTFNYFKETIDKMIKLTRLKPEIIACDLHPNYNSSIYAEELAKKYNAKLIKIQHHKAHIASVAAEHYSDFSDGLNEYIGIAMDGLGFGDDASIYGGEVFYFNGKDFLRIGHLEEQYQLSDSFTLYPKKMLFSILTKFLDFSDIIKTEIFEKKEKKEYLLLYNAIKQNFNLIKTTSTGRILDSVSALLGLCDYRDYDGRPAILLESFAYENFLKKDFYEFEPVINQLDDRFVLMTTPLIKFIYEILKKTDEKNLIKTKKKLALTTHIYLAKGMLKIANKYINNFIQKNFKYPKTNNKKIPILFSGGVANNSIITSIMLENNVLINEKVPCGDGNISLGQAYLSNILK